MPTLDRDGAIISWHAQGPETAPVLVMLHGSWSDRSDFTDFAPLMAKDFRVITYDRRGHGASTEPPGPGLTTEDVADLAAVIEAQEAGPVHVFGHSFGAIIALKLAAARPELIDRLALHEPPLVRHLEPGSALMSRTQDVAGQVIELTLSGAPGEAARRFVDELVYSPGTWEQLPPPVRRMLTENARTFVDELQDPDGTRVDFAALAEFDRPLLATRGSISPELFQVSAGLVAAALPGARHFTVVGAGHAPHMTHAKDYAALLTRFFLDR